MSTLEGIGSYLRDVYAGPRRSVPCHNIQMLTDSVQMAISVTIMTGVEHPCTVTYAKTSFAKIYV